MTARAPSRCRKKDRVVRVIALEVALALVPGLASAASPALPIELAWDAPPSCPPSDDIEADVRRLFADASLPEVLPPIAARVSLRETPDGGYELRMRTTSGGEERERELRTQTCEEARALVTLLLALLIDPRARLPGTQDANPARQAPPETARSEPPNRSEPAPSLQTERGSHSSFIASLAVVGEVGVLPGGSAGVELRVGVLMARWSVEVRGAAWLPRHAEATSMPGAGAEFDLVEAGIVGCVRSGASDPALEGCLGGSLLSLKGEGYGVSSPSSDGAVFVGVTGEGALVLSLSSRVELRPALGVLVPLRRPTFAIHDVGTVHRQAAAAGRASIGLRVRF